MDLALSSQYRQVRSEKEDLKKRLNNFERRFLLLEKTLKHTSEIKIARDQAKKKQIVSQEKLFNRLGL